MRYIESGFVLISVIVPVYNIEEYLPQCIDSIINQSYGELEIILVGDGSTDSGGNICDRYARMDSRIKVIHKENGGLVSARKAGVNRAAGEYVTFVDGDDWIEQDAYQKLIDSGQGADIIAFACYEEYGDYQSIRKNNIEEGLYITENQKNFLYKTMFMVNNFYDFGLMASLWSKLIRRNLIVENQNKVSDQISYGEDVSCTFPCLLDAESVCVTNMPLYHYRQRQGSMVKGSAAVPCSNFINIYDLLRAKFGQDLLLQRQLHFYMWFILLAKAYESLGTGMPLFPFSKVALKTRIAVYGAGTFGRTVKEYCDRHQHIDVAVWSDLHYTMYRKQGLDVVSPETLKSREFDVVVIAILNETLAVCVKDEMVKDGISEERIDWVRQDILASAPLPDWVKAG